MWFLYKTLTLSNAGSENNLRCTEMGGVIQTLDNILKPCILAGSSVGAGT